MRVSYSWLKDFVEIKDSAEGLSAKLTMAGLEVSECKKIAGDWVLEIEITSNRPDWLSHIGIAREVAAITNRKLKSSGVNKLPSSNSQTRKLANSITIKLEDKIGCPLYTARIISNVSVKATTDVITQRLGALSLRGVNNIVDSTNYCLFETGQPVHAFDLDKILKRSGVRGQGSEVEIIVRRARPSEKIITIDGVERSLSAEILVIADKAGPVAIAGVMGGKDTEVDTSTKTILLESAYFDPIIIRRSRQRLGINTDSSYRFERGVHIPTVYSAQNRIQELVSRFSPSANFSKIFEAKNSAKAKASKKILTVDIASINQLLGLAVSKERVKNILISLGFKVKGSKGDKLRLEAPDFRQDINIGEDVAEEVARIFGFDNIKTTTPRIDIAQARKIDPLGSCERIIKTILCSSGFFEVIPYSLTSQEKAAIVSQDKERIIEIENPLSKELGVLRPSLLAGLLDVAGYNFNRSEDDVKIFHIGSTFMRGQNGVEETPNLGVLAYGKKTADWHRSGFLKERNQFNFFDLKGIVEEILEESGLDLGVVSFKTADSPAFTPGNCARIEIGDKSIGLLGKISPVVLSQWDIRKSDIFASLIDLKELCAFLDLNRQFKMFSLFPSSRRDVSFIVKDDIQVEKIKNAILEKRVSFLRKVSLFDEYRDSKLPAKCRSLSFSLEFNAPDRTLKEDEVNKAMQEIKQLLLQDFSVTFR